MTDLPIGTIGVTPTYGNAWDRFVGSAIRWVTAYEDYSTKEFTDAKVNHAVVYVGEVQGFAKPQLVEARPGGACFVDWDNYGDNMIWMPQVSQLGTTPLGAPILSDPLQITDTQRSTIRETAIDCAVKGIGYNYLDFVAIGLAQKRFGQLVRYDTDAWWVKRLSRPDRLICSQLVDYCYNVAGLHLFVDNRPAGLVSPADLYLLGVNNG